MGARVSNEVLSIAGANPIAQYSVVSTRSALRSLSHCCRNLACAWRQAVPGDQPHNRNRQRVDRLLPGRSGRRLRPDWPERPPGFQEIDQLAIMKPCTKWADRVYNLKRIPDQVNCAFQKAMSGKPGPVYLDFPGDVLYAKIAEEQVDWSLSGRPLLNARPLGDPEKIDRWSTRSPRRVSRSYCPGVA